MKYLLDTNVLSELRRGTRAQPGVQAWARRQPLPDLAISALSLLEIEIGTQRLARHDPRQAGHLSTWLHQQIRPKFQGRILPVDEMVALQAAQLHVPNPAPERDALIAATALVHGLVMVTRNVSDFRRASALKVFNPWLAENNA